LNIWCQDSGDRTGGLVYINFQWTCQAQLRSLSFDVLFDSGKISLNENIDNKYFKTTKLLNSVINVQIKDFTYNTISIPFTKVGSGAVSISIDEVNFYSYSRVILEKVNGDIINV